MSDSPKQTIREQARYHRDHMHIDQADYERVVDVFFDHFTIDKDSVVAGYWPFEREFDPRSLMDELHQRGHQIALPCVEKDTKVLTFKPWKPDDKLEKGAYGVFEPQGNETFEPNVFLCPLLAFDRHGYRMGQGGGYYDATIAHYREKSDILTIGVGYGEQAVLFNLPKQDHDQKMDAILTPQKVMDFRK